MAATTYTGNGSTQSILNSNNTTTSVSFQPDLVWLKARNSATSNYLFDAVRGVSNYLISDSTAAEATAGNTLTAFNSNGFSLSSSAGVNFNTNTYIAWQWKAGGSTSTNTSGTITSTVSVNATAGFSVVTWTGTGASGASVGHGLSTLPQFVIIKKRNVAENWYVAAYATQGLNYAYHLFLNTTGALSASNDPYLLSGQSSLTSSTLALADGTSNNGGNQNGTTYVAYCWTPISGYSAFGSYTGNGSTDGPFIYTGFRPRWVMVKGTAITSWYVWDSSRATYNVMNETLYPNLSNAESGSGGIIDFLSNGFKLRTTASDLNSSGATQIYAAFAENPFKYALAR
ncbi:MAG: hypothetical protein AMS22_05545 [Thiotrichales bacterium SG8_50]|nr:MAG: hypothetical protein AMS22_05545 [Thiotrichales bacterium SG8_50]